MAFSLTNGLFNGIGEFCLAYLIHEHKVTLQRETALYPDIHNPDVTVILPEITMDNFEKFQCAGVHNIDDLKKLIEDDLKFRHYPRSKQWMKKVKQSDINELKNKISGIRDNSCTIL